MSTSSRRGPTGPPGRSNKGQRETRFERGPSSIPFLREAGPLPTQPFYVNRSSSRSTRCENRPVSRSERTPLSCLSPKTRVGDSRIQGKGRFAAEPITAGETVAVKGGHIVGRKEIRELRRRLGPAEIQIADDLFIAPVDEEEREGSMIFSNHS